MTWSRQQYEDRMRDRLGDLGILQHIAETSIPLALERAIATFTKDRPRIAIQSFDGDGTNQTFDLLSDPDSQNAWSRIESIEHPTGDIPKTFLDSHGWEESEGELRITAAPATGTDNVVVRFLALWAFPDDDPDAEPNPIPEVYAHAIADLGAAGMARSKGAEYARQVSTSVAGDLFQRDPEPLFSAAADLTKSYEATVLGRPAGDDASPQVVLDQSDVDVFPASLFHRRSDYIRDESLSG